MPLFGGSKAQRGGCPFSSGKGYATDQGRMDWLRAHGLAERDVSTSLDANPDPSAPLYYWQIHSLLGPRRIEDLVTNFYRRVYADFEDTHFRTAFTQISGIEHHIATQTAFWIDVMGGGRAYHGGDFRLNFHHTHNAASVMNAAGATRWMYHMGNALCETNFSDVDARIKPCIVDFLRVKMKKYASQHGWRFNEADFDFVHRDPEVRVLYEAEVVATLTPDVLGATGSKELKRFLVRRIQYATQRNALHALHARHALHALRARIARTRTLHALHALRHARTHTGVLRRGLEHLRREDGPR